MRRRGRAWLAAALFLGGCSEICETPAGPPASCILIALGLNGQSLMVITPECGIRDTNVDVASVFSGQELSLYVDAEGRSEARSLFSFGEDQLVFSWGGDCKTKFCAQVNGAGPAHECDGFAGAGAE
jgi:hypothetical protein